MDLAGVVGKFFAIVASSPRAWIGDRALEYDLMGVVVAPVVVFITPCILLDMKERKHMPHNAVRHSKGALLILHALGVDVSGAITMNFDV